MNQARDSDNQKASTKTGDENIPEEDGMET